LRARMPDGIQPQGQMTLAVRPEKISLLRDLPGGEVPGSNALTGRLDEVVYVGTHTQYLIRLPGGQMLTVYRQNRAVGENEPATGEALSVVFNPQSAALLAD
jgi:ABC-type Fe3+/spermidine/putrescine transport system ATPase subunit